jgi:hypothetical protein
MGIFALLWLGFVLLGVGGYALGIAALISIARAPVEAFGPWWDNTRQAWVLGVALSFLVPLGPIIAGLLWFTTGKNALRYGPFFGRPFWAGAPKPVPPPYWPAPAPPWPPPQPPPPPAGSSP